MLKIFFIVLLSSFCIECFSQDNKIQKSTEIISIHGKNFYLHTVMPGQTFYSICKAYGISIDELKELNGKNDDKLSLYEVLKIPYIKTFVQEDKNYFYYKMAAGETMYSIARKCGIKPKRLLKYNKQYADAKSLPVGSVIRIPLKEIKGSALQTLRKSMEERFHEKRNNSSADTSKVVNVVHQLPVTNTDEIKISTTEDIIDTNMVLVREGVKIALLLPFMSEQYPECDTLPEYLAVHIMPRTEQFLNFFEGFLLSVDSLKRSGKQIDLHVFDTERNVNKMGKIAVKLDSLSPDLIIGPVYSSVCESLLEKMQNKDIPVVYPLSSRSSKLHVYPNLIQVNADFDTMIEQMANWLLQQSNSANIIRLNIGNGGLTTEENLILNKQFEKVASIRNFVWDVSAMPLSHLKSLLRTDIDNILILPTTKEADISKILPVLSALTDEYKISLLGLPEWMQFSSVDFENFYKLNTYIFTYSYVNYSTSEAKIFADNYRKYFCSEPNSLSYKAYDLGMYFINLALQYKRQLLQKIEYNDDKLDFSTFRFRRMGHGLGYENRAFFIVNFSSDFNINIE